MKRWIWIPVCSLVLLVPVLVFVSGARGFNGVVHSIESRYHVRAHRIPLMGLVSTVAWAASHGGVAHLHVAEFEHFTAAVNGNDLNRMVKSKLGRGWQPMVRETSRIGHRQTLVFSRPEGNRMGLFVLDYSGHELNVVQLSVNPDRLNESIAQYEHLRHHSSKSD